MFMRPRDSWQQWVLPEEQRDKAVHAPPQQASPGDQQQQPGGKAKGGSGASGEPAVEASEQRTEEAAGEPAAAAGQAEEQAPSAAAIEAAAPAQAAQQPPVAAEPAGPAQPAAVAPAPAVPAVASPPPPPSHDVKSIAEEEELNEDDMFQLDEVRCCCNTVPAQPRCLPSPRLLVAAGSAASGPWVRPRPVRGRPAGKLGDSRLPLPLDAAQPLCAAL